MTALVQAPKRALASALCGVGFLLLPLVFVPDGTEPSRWATFLGGFHPLILHLPIGIVAAIAAFELWNLRRTNADSRLRQFLWLIAALSASISFATGYLLGGTGGREQMLLIPHLWFAGAFTALSWFALGLLLLRDIPALRLAAVVVATVPMIGAGHYGGLMVHGSPFVSAPWKPDPTARQILPPLEDQIEVYADIVQPILTAKCQSCHGPGKQNGRLRMDSFERLLAGGTHGPALLAGRAAESRMLKMIALPPANDKHMPPRNRPQLTEPEIALLHWWIDERAAPDLVIAKAEAPPVIQPFLVSEYRLLQDPALIAQQQADEKRRRETEARRREELERLRATLPADLREAFLFSSETSADLAFILATSPDEFADDDLKVVAPLLAECRNIQMAGAAISDTGLAGVTFSPTLRQLSLKDTAIGTAGLQSLESAPQLESLNLFGTKVDSGIGELLSRLPGLRRLYLGNTRLSEDERAALLLRFPNCEIIGSLGLPVAAGAMSAPLPSPSAAPNP